MQSSCNQEEIESAQCQERHYSVAEIAEIWNLSRDVVRKIFQDEPGVMNIGNDRSRSKRGYHTLRIPQSVMERVHRRLCNPDLTPGRGRRSLQSVGTASCGKQLTAPDHFSLTKRPRMATDNPTSFAVSESEKRGRQMLTIYRRHVKKCAHRSDGRKYRRCPIWADGFLGRAEIRKSLDTRDWEKAQDIIRQWEAEGSQTQEQETITVAQAWEDFLDDAKARKLEASTIYKYDLLSRQMKSFAENYGLRFLRELDLARLRKFRTTWPNQNLGALKKLEYLRAFFRFARESKWIDENPARHLKSPRVKQRPTMPYTPDQMAEILSACERYGNKTRGGLYRGPENARRIRAFVLLLRHSGLRIGDAVALKRCRITDGKLFLYTAKTETPVYCPLPDFVLIALAAVPKVSDKYFFWTGESKVSSATGDWQRRLHGLFKEAEIPDGHAHRFRDTFAVELLKASVPMERVSMLLGHSSIKVTEKYYSPWVAARQEQLEPDVRRTWDSLPETKGTPEVHKIPEGANLVQ